MGGSYKEQLRDPRWQRRRLEKLQAANWLCECCGSGDKELQIHHLNYIDGALPWQYDDSYLEVLCAECHRWRESWNAVFCRSMESTAHCMSDASIIRAWMRWRIGVSPASVQRAVDIYDLIATSAYELDGDEDERLSLLFKIKNHKITARAALQMLSGDEDEQHIDAIL